MAQISNRLMGDPRIDHNPTQYSEWEIGVIVNRPG